MSPALHRLQSVDKLVSQIETRCHPGLMLDKLLRFVPEQQEVKEVAVSVTGTEGDPELLKKLLGRRDKVLMALKASTWAQRTLTPMALHLARAALLENANVCLHRTYGFAYMPASGLKGMARAWAETIWLPAQADQTSARITVDRIFGWGNTPWHRDDMERCPDAVQRVDATDPESGVIADKAGAVVFHDAWPTTWPKLVLDVLTPHHSKYYGAPDKAVPHPGDWENPIPVNFLTIAQGTEFHFAVSGNSGMGASKEDIALAQEFLQGALAHLGAGSKTSAGYGVFEDRGVALPNSKDRRSFPCVLKLATPAFLAGPDQHAAEGCELRGATLRGQLRWWWRTLHAAHLAPKELRRLEQMLWGSSSLGGAIALTVAPTEGPKEYGVAYRLDRDKLIPQLGSKNNELAYRKEHAPKDLPRLLELNKVTPGLTYLSYGMAEKGGARYYRLPGTSWAINLRFKPACEKTPDGKVIHRLGVERVEQEALASLWLLTRYGGVGSKSRKGFGSLEPVTISGIGGIEDCQRIAKETRTLLKVSSAEKDRTPAIEDRIEKGPVLFKNATSLHVLNEVGYSLSMFGAMHAHNAEKKTLGLPRKVDTKKPRPFVVDRAVGDRHASPWHLKISTSTEGLEVRYIAFPSPWLGGPALSKEWLNKLGDHLMADLKLRANEKATITSDFAQNPGVGTAVRPVGPPKPLVYTPKVVSGLEKLIKEFPARSFVVGQSNSNAKKVDEFLGIAKAIERTDEVEKYFAEIKSALQLHDKGKLKEYRKNRPYLQPLVDFLLGDPQR